MINHIINTRYSRSVMAMDGVSVQALRLFKRNEHVNHFYKEMVTRAKRRKIKQSTYDYLER